MFVVQLTRGAPRGTHFCWSSSRAYHPTRRSQRNQGPSRVPCEWEGYLVPGPTRGGRGRIQGSQLGNKEPTEKDERKAVRGWGQLGCCGPVGVLAATFRGFCPPTNTPCIALWVSQGFLDVPPPCVLRSQTFTPSLREAWGWRLTAWVSQKFLGF